MTGATCEKGVTVVSVGVGARVDAEQLLQLSTQPAEDYAIMVPDYPTLGSMGAQVLGRICQAGLEDAGH